MNISVRLALCFLLGLSACQGQEQGNQEKAKKPGVAEIHNTSEEEKMSDVKEAPINFPTLRNEDFLMGRFDPASHEDFVAVPRRFADRGGMYVYKACGVALTAMCEKAKSEGIDLVVRSAARNFDYQRSIWEAKWSGDRILSSGINASKDIPDHTERCKEIMKYSAMPGTSRHHWGTDVDFNAFNNEYFEKGEGLKVFTWLEANAASFGFARPYIAKGTERPNGYEEEKWHWSYLPVSTELTKYALELLEDANLAGFSGATKAEQLKVKEHYILGIANSCKQWH